jgi:predicted DCC family thiol-disulfide oxidoreductase YuxK
MRQKKDRVVIFYDGVCALCNGLVRFILRFDGKAVFNFASLQSGYARETLVRHQRNPADLDTVVVVAKGVDGKERLYSKSEAMRFILSRLGGLWTVVAALLRPWPTSLLDRAYDAIAKSRYRIFGKLDHCPLPNPRFAERFVDFTEKKDG